MAKAVVRAKSKTTMMAPDGVGGLAVIHDRRFEKDWVVTLEVSKEEADQWLVYLSAEGERQGWSSSSIGQLDGRENSGSITFRSIAMGGEQADFAWFRTRGDTLEVRAKPAKGSALSVDDLKALIQKVSDASLANETQPFFRAWHLRYDGLPWKGEVWLTDKLRLSAPSGVDPIPRTTC